MSKDDTPLVVIISPDRMKRFGSLDDAKNWLESVIELNAHRPIAH